MEEKEITFEESQAAVNVLSVAAISGFHNQRLCQSFAEKLQLMYNAPVEPEKEEKKSE